MQSSNVYIGWSRNIDVVHALTLLYESHVRMVMTMMMGNDDDNDDVDDDNDGDDDENDDDDDIRC